MAVDLTIKRSALVMIIDQAIEEGKKKRTRHDPEIAKFQRDALREIARTTPAVDVGAFKYHHGCPATQAGLCGSPILWFTGRFDALMHLHLEHRLGDPWTVKVIDDLPKV